MQLTLFLGQIISIFWVVMGLAIIFHKERFKKIFLEFCEKPSLLAMTGFFNLVIGAVFVVSHNIWVMNFQGLITFISWLILIHAIMRLLFPTWVTMKGKAMLQKENYLIIMGWIVLIVGVYIGYMSFYHIPVKMLS